MQRAGGEVLKVYTQDLNRTNTTGNQPGRKKETENTYTQEMAGGLINTLMSDDGGRDNSNKPK